MTNLKTSIIVVGFMALIFLIKAHVFLDPDFGWHLRMGEYIVRNGIPSGDPFSYTMPSFSFIDHEWLTNVIFFHTFPFLQRTGFAFIFTLLALASIGISLRNSLSRNLSRNISYTLLLFVISCAVFLDYFGIRPQVQSWLYLSILLYLLFNESTWRRFRLLTPFLFLLWTNMHGSYGAGISILIFVLTIRSLRKRSIDFNDGIVVISSILATFINPYGYQIWRELWQQVSDNSLRWSISEWMPSIFSFNIFLIMLWTLSTSLLVRYKKKFTLEEKALFIVLLFQAVTTARHVPLWVLFAIPITYSGFTYLQKEAQQIPHAKKRLDQLVSYFFIACLLLLLIQLYIVYRSTRDISESTFYPSGAITYLRNNPFEGNLFSEYGWGGYLLWQYPDKRVFIDGRMPSWRWEMNPDSEEGYAFRTYAKIVSGEESYRQTFEKYNVSYVLWPKERELDAVSQTLVNLEKEIGERRGVKREFDFKKDLVADGWVSVYEDEVSVIYQRPN